MSRSEPDTRDGESTVDDKPTIRSAARNLMVQAEMPFRRFVERTFRLTPHQIAGLKAIREEASREVGYPRFTMDEVGRCMVEYLRESEDPIAVLERLRAKASTTAVD